MEEEKQKIINKYRKQVKPGKSSFNYYILQDNGEPVRISVKDMFEDINECIREISPNNKGMSMVNICKNIKLLETSIPATIDVEKEEPIINIIEPDKKKTRKKRNDAGEKRIVTIPQEQRKEILKKAGGPNKLNLKVL